MIFGVALLAACFLIGSFAGNLLGLVTGVNSDVGGVGFAMLLLLVLTNSKTVNRLMPKGYEKGIDFWKEMFIPVIIAMSASQNVVSALSGGWLALATGLGVVVAAFAMMVLLNKLSSKKDDNKETEVKNDD